MAESLLFEQLREKADGLERENERLREEVQRLSELVGSKQLQIENLKNQIERNESDEEEVDIAPPRLGDQPIEHNQIHEEEIEVVEMIPKCIKEMLKPHQIEGINFLRSILKGKRVRLSKVCAKLALIAKIGQKFLNASKERSIRNFGCILADCMGLGKTLQLLVALYLFMAEESYSRKYRIIIIVPLNVSLHWIHEIEKLQRWIALDDSLWQLPAPYFMDSTLNLAMRRYVLKEWNFKGGIMVLGYEMCREIMSDPEMVLQPDVICLDEGHRIKNLHSSISETLSSFSTQRRVRN